MAVLLQVQLRIATTRISNKDRVELAAEVVEITEAVAAVAVIKFVSLVADWGEWAGDNVALAAAFPVLAAARQKGNATACSCQ